MSSWRKAAKSNQKTHRERHQPESRKHLGILEKKQDYKKRAVNQNEKEETLKLLRKRALDKNPDEFYHHMINSKLHDGEHHEKDNEDVHTPDQVKLMDTQDIQYIAMKRTIEAKKIARLQSQLHMIDAANQVKNRHVFFVDDEEDVKKFDLAKRLDTHPSLIDRKTNRPKLSDLEKLKLPDFDAETLRRLAAERAKSYKELSRRVEREKELSVIQHKLEMKRTLKQDHKLKPKKIKPGTKDSAPVYEFKYERKK